LREAVPIEKHYLFDPFAWLEKAASPGRAHLVLRAAAVVLLFGFLAHRISQYPDYFFKPLWVVETLIYVVFIVSYAVRMDPLVRSRGAKEILVPLAGAVLPFALLFTRPAPWIAHRPPCLYAVFSFMTAATALTVWGLWALRRSFSITVEVRNVVKRGPYRFVRHPVYLGEMCTAAAVMVWRFSVTNTALFALFVVIQLVRARWEESKLAKAFPAYHRYCQATWWFTRSGK
jgi:protein-S-isoprenylcysteine O-methyltransferase Ste14